MQEPVEILESCLAGEDKALEDDKKAAARTPWYRLLPFNPFPLRGCNVDKRFPGMEAGWLSLMTYHWCNKIIWHSYRSSLQLRDLWRLHPRLHADRTGEDVMHEWDRAIKRHGGDASKVSMSWCFFRAMRWSVLRVFFLMFLFSILSFIGQALLLFELLTFAQKPVEETDVYDGVLLALGLFLTETVRSMVFGIHWYYGVEIGVRLRSAINILVYNKILRLRNLGSMTVGQLVNLCVNDSERLFNTGMTCGFAIQTPLMVAGTLAYSIYLVGWPALLGFSTFILFFYLTLLISKQQAKYRQNGIKVTDVRVRTMNEILTSVKLIKMYAWEQPFSSYVASVRAKEKDQLRKSAYLQGTASSLVFVVPAVATVVTLATHALTGGDLSIAQAFALLATFGAMRHPLGTLPYFVRILSETHVALPRLKKLLLMPEKAPVSEKVSDSGLVIEMKDATLAWDVRESEYKKATKDVKLSNMDRLRMGLRRKSSAATPLLYSDSVKQRANGTAAGKSSALAFNQPHLSQTSSRGLMASLASMPPDDSADVPDCLVDISFTVGRGELIGICGTFGSGKSSMLSALLGGMNLRSGSMAFQGSIAYVSQQAWIFNASVQENVLCGLELDEERYTRALSAAALLQDLDILPDGDMTEIGERGINLSGGQKQRVSLARALYSNRDVYLLDDPLSAVDAHVGAHIFSELIKRELKGKTVLLVTHQLQYLPYCDRVALMVGGRLAGVEKYATLVTKNAVFASLIDSFQCEKAAEAAAKSEQRSDLGASYLDTTASLEDLYESDMSLAAGNDGEPADQEGDVKKAPPATLVKAEDRASGSISWATYLAFIRACGGALPVLALLFMSLIAAGAQAGTDYWLSYWLKQGSGSTGNTSSTIPNDTLATTTTAHLASAVSLTGVMTDEATAFAAGMDPGSISDNPKLGQYIGIYFGLTFLLSILSIIRSLLAMYVLLNGCSRLHDLAFRKVFRAPMSFFESTPIGQIVNRFSKDMDELDAAMPFGVGIVVRNWFTILLLVLFASSVYPYLFIVLFVTAILFGLIYRVYILFSRDIKRLDGITRTPYISHLTATIQGLSTVHAYGLNSDYQRRFSRLLDGNTVCHQAFYLGSRWLAFRLDILAAIITSATALTLVVFRDSVDVSLGAVALAYVVQLGGQLQLTTRMMSEVEARFTSVERLNYYATQLDEEAPEHLEDTDPPPEWPFQGRVTFDNVCMRYREGTPQVLHELSFDVKA
eukprot:scpid53440/ scgid33788/ Multidrug resistance-associated protein 5; ATP-binding cassette sub-family C member 5; Multi-specific organic anion transporter C; SMRP; pABC11